MREPISLKEILAVVVRRGGGILLTVLVLAAALGAYKLKNQLELSKLPENSAEYIEEEHRTALMEFEEQKVFSYVNGLLSGSIEDKFRISTYSEYHEEVGDKLKELKNIIIKYCPDSADINLLNDALYDIYRCEQELESHCMVEDRIFVPAVVKLERKVREDVQR